MIQLSDTFISLLFEILKISAIGVISGLIGSRIALKEFQKQTKLQAKHQHYLDQINALREILVILPTIFLSIHFKWELPEDSPISSKQNIASLTNQLLKTRSLFLLDSESTKILDSIYSLIGEDRKSLLHRGAPSEIIDSIKIEVENKIREIESKVY